MWVIVAGLTLALAGLLAYADLRLAPLSLLVPLVAYAYKTYTEGKARREVDEQMPRALLELSSLPIRTYDDVLRALSRGYGRLSEEVRRIINARMPAERKIRALEGLGGEATRVAAEAIITGMRAGANMRELMRSVASDLEARMNMERSKSASLALQRYSTMLTAGVFVPAVLGLVVRIARGLMETGLFEESATASTVIGLLPYHVGIVALETALFLALVDGKPRNVAVYAVLLLPLAVGIYFALAG